MTQEKGPPVPLPGFVGWRFDPPWAWLFAKGVYGPPDLRPGLYGEPTMEFRRAQRADFAGYHDPHKLFKYTYGPGHA